MGAPAAAPFQVAALWSAPRSASTSSVGTDTHDPRRLRPAGALAAVAGPLRARYRAGEGRRSVAAIIRRRRGRGRHQAVANVTRPRFGGEGIPSGRRAGTQRGRRLEFLRSLPCLRPHAQRRPAEDLQTRHRRSPAVCIVIIRCIPAGISTTVRRRRYRCRVPVCTCRRKHDALLRPLTRPWPTYVTPDTCIRTQVSRTSGHTRTSLHVTWQHQYFRCRYIAAPLLCLLD